MLNFNWGSFNPCFNGSMYKNRDNIQFPFFWFGVSILVLMDLCIKTKPLIPLRFNGESFNPCFNGSMYKNNELNDEQSKSIAFQSLF